MQLTINKSVSKLVGIWIFILLLIFKGILPKPAYAFLSSLDACAVKPECAAAIGSELSPAITAPTAAGSGATTISTTTATGATTSSVQAVAGATVVRDMRLPGVAAFYIWNRAQNEQAQNKAKERYCSVYPYDENFYTNTGNNSAAVANSFAYHYSGQGTTQYWDYDWYK
ncbi:hypothetical protein [Nostoc sp. MG11]|uniref:hypothetical protein n=1 Tax=Nostoc sp. MG11 TaxID=2721166 RepID=UPI001867489A|nr:hypothetical protein [Nostoc sp. MG11]